MFGIYDEDLDNWRVVIWFGCLSRELESRCPTRWSRQSNMAIQQVKKSPTHELACHVKSPSLSFGKKQPFLVQLCERWAQLIHLLGKYKEVQIHGEIDLHKHVDRIVINERHQARKAIYEEPCRRFRVKF